MDDRPGQTVNIGVARVDAQGSCVYANDRIAKIFGVTREELLGRNWQSISPEFWSRIPEERWDEIRAGRSVVSVGTHVRADGRRISVQIEMMPELDSEGRVTSVALTCVDITAHEWVASESQRHRDRAAARLEELEELYQNTPVALCVVDCDLRYVRTNRHYAEIVGYEPGDLIGRSMWDVIRPSSRAEAVDVMKRVISTGEPVLDADLRRVVPGKPELAAAWLVNVHPVRRDGAVVGAMAVMQDITDVCRAEEIARERLSELESIYANSPVGLSFIDRDLRYVRVNQVIADMNGISIDEVVGKTYRDLAPDTADLAEPFFRLVAERGQSVRNLEVRTRPPSDPEREHTYLLSIDPMRNAEGDVSGLVTAAQDVTDQRSAETTASRRLEELELVYTNTPVGLCHMDTDLRVVHMNPLFARLSGRPFEELIGESAADLFPDSIAQHLVPQFRHVALTGMAWPGLQFRACPPGPMDREYTWIASTHAARRNGQVTGLVTVLQDVTALADRQHETETVSNRLAEAQRVANLGSWEWNLLDDSVWWSRELFEIFGVPPTFTPTYTGFFERVHASDRSRVRKQIESTLRDDQPYRLSYRIIRGDGSEGVLFTVARLERTLSGQPARLVGTCQDITKFGPPTETSVRGRRSPGAT